MRFDYQPALVNVRILKNSRHRKLFLILGAGIIGCLIILSSIAHTLVTYKKVDNNSYLPSDLSNLEPTANNLFSEDNNNLNLTVENNNNHLKSLNFKDLKSTLAVNQPISNIKGIGINNEVKLPNNLEAGSVLDLSLPQKNLSTEVSNNSDTGWKVVKINSGDTLVSILKNLLMPLIYIKDFNNFISSNQLCKAAVSNIKVGSTLKILFDFDRNLKTIKLSLSPNKTLFIDRVGPKNYKSYYEEKPIIKKLVFAQNKIGSSFYAAARAVNLNDNLIMEIAEIFGWDIDFSMDLRPNDNFKILYEEKFVDQEKIGTGHIIIAEFINQGQKYQAIRFTDQHNKSSYYTPDGYSMNKAFLRNPVKFTRIGSKFSVSRRHPILHRLRAHKGVDYVAPSGTPVKAAGDGKVVLIGKKGGYGNVIELLHGNKYSTLYAHLSSFAHGIKQNQFVKQGQVIGYVGRTGLATGDHLHYEFRVNGEHRDPLTVQLPRAMPLPSNYRVKFLSHAKQMVNLLNENESSKVNKA